MTKTIRVVFDGEVLHLEQSVDLQPNTRYLVTIERAVSATKTSFDETHPQTDTRKLATDPGMTNLALPHGRYGHRRIEDEPI